MARTGLAIKIMGGLGALWLVFVIISASQPPRDRGALSTKEAMGALVGFEAAFPPRPIPPMRAVGEDELEVSLKSLATPVLVTLFIPGRCPGCGDAIEKLQAASSLSPAAERGRANLTVLYVSPRAEADPPPQGGTILLDTDGRFDSYIGGSTRSPMLVIYTKERGEVGRITGNAPWTAEALAQFVEALAASG